MGGGGGGAMLWAKVSATGHLQECFLLWAQTGHRKLHGKACKHSSASNGHRQHTSALASCADRYAAEVAR